MGRGTGAVMGLPKALTGSIVMDRDSANGVLTFVEVQKKKSSLRWSTTGMFYSSHLPSLRRQGVTFALVSELFSNVSKDSAAHAHLLNCYVFQTDFS